MSEHQTTISRNKAYWLIGLTIVSLQFLVVVGARMAQGEPKAIELEPWKVRGNPEALTSLIVFSDFQCPYCMYMHHVLKSVLEDFPNELKIVFKHFPLKIHKHAVQAAEAAECAGDQGKFNEYEDMLFHFNNWRVWNFSKEPKKNFVQFAHELSLDMTAFQQCVESGIKKVVIDKNTKEGLNSFVRGTPTCLLDGRKIITKRKPEDIKNLIRKEVYRKK